MLKIITTKRLEVIKTQQYNLGLITGINIGEIEAMQDNGAVVSEHTRQAIHRVMKIAEESHGKQ